MNAKELILSKINAGTDLAGIYIYLIILGVDFSDISDFMKSDTLQTIVKVSRSNIFDDYASGNSLNSAISLIENYLTRGFISLDLYNLSADFTSNKMINKLTKELSSRHGVDVNGMFKREKAKSNSSKIMAILNHFVTDVSMDSSEFQSLLKLVGNDKTAVARLVNDYKYYSKLFKNINFKIFKEFKTIKGLADELRIFGNILSINQGMATDTQGLFNYKQRIEQLVYNREKEYALSTNRRSILSDETIIGNILRDKPYLSKTLGEEKVKEIFKQAKDQGVSLGNFDFFKFLENEDYRNTSIQYYNLIKGTYNILDVINEVPHYKEMIKAYWVSVQQPYLLSGRQNLTLNLANKISKDKVFNGRELFPVSLDEQDIRNLSDLASDVIINNWLKHEQIVMILPKGNNLVYRNTNVSEDTTVDSLVQLDTPEGQATFINWFNYKFLRQLKSGNTDQGLNSAVSNNKFVKDLIISIKDDKSSGYNYDLVSLNINMTSLNS